MGGVGTQPTHRHQCAQILRWVLDWGISETPPPRAGTVSVVGLGTGLRQGHPWGRHGETRGAGMRAPVGLGTGPSVGQGTGPPTVGQRHLQGWGQAHWCPSPTAEVGPPQPCLCSRLGGGTGGWGGVGGAALILPRCCCNFLPAAPRAGQRFPNAGARKGRDEATPGSWAKAPAVLPREL